MGIVRGRVVLSRADRALTGTRFLIVEVVTPARLAAVAAPPEGPGTDIVAGRSDVSGGERGGTGRVTQGTGLPRRAQTLIVADRLNPGPGQMVGFVEGREAANPYGPGGAPVDAYCSLIIDQVDYRPPANTGQSG